MKKENTKETLIDKNIMNIFDSISKTSDKIIESKEEVFPFCVIIDDDYKISDVIGMQFGSGNEKIIIRNNLKKLILNNKTKGYILIQDSVMTMIDIKTGKHETKDVVIKQIYTPKEKYMEMVFYKDNKITERKVMSSEELKKMSSEWNVWEDKEYKYDNSEYEKIKRENPERYRSVS